MLEIHTKTTLKYVVNQDGICFHRWLSKKENIKTPDLLVYDLDPPGKDFSAVAKAASRLKLLIEGLGGKPFVMTTGSKGVHIVIPIKPEKDFDEVREIAKKIARRAVKEDPENLTTKVRKEKRGGKIFLDYLRNTYGHTAISPYSLRSLKDAPVATPLDWDELSDNNLNSQTFNFKNIFKRLSRIKDPWNGINRYRWSLEEVKL
jgi:bifunctional non-homologous end joining protein LigD